MIYAYHLYIALIGRVLKEINRERKNKEKKTSKSWAFLVGKQHISIIQIDFRNVLQTKSFLLITTLAQSRQLEVL